MVYRSRILIVDDDFVNVVILEEILGGNHLLKTAASGEQALAIAVDFHPDLVLLDIMMPGINGYETCRRMRATPAVRHTKIIMVSAAEMVEERLRGYEAGADDYVTKPFDPEELLAKVRVYLRLRSVEELDQLKTDLLALLHHETDSPLNGILLTVDLLRTDEAIEAEERKELLDMVYQSAYRLHKLFQKGMTLCALKSGKWDFRFVPADLCEVVRAACREVAAQAGERNVRIAQELPHAALTVLDSEDIKSVVTTLLDNAIRFSPTQGQVVVKVWRESDRCCLTVTDRGTGIAPDFLPHVFEGFASPDITHHSEGQGLSLAIARRIVLAHNGTMGVESAKQLGTTFTVQLPLIVPSTQENIGSQL
jgi:signal transduction histidine kinase